MKWGRSETGFVHQRSPDSLISNFRPYEKQISLTVITNKFKMYEELVWLNFQILHTVKISMNATVSDFLQYIQNLERTSHALLRTQMFWRWAITRSCAVCRPTKGFFHIPLYHRPRWLLASIKFCKVQNKRTLFTCFFVHWSFSFRPPASMPLLLQTRWKYAGDHLCYF